MNEELSRFFQFLVKTGKLRSQAETVSLLQRSDAQVRDHQSMIRLLQQHGQLDPNINLTALHAEYQQFVSRPPSDQGAVSRTDAVTRSGSSNVMGPPAVSAGQMIGSHRILKELGHGACGVVYLAEDTMLGRKVVIKQMLPGATIEDRIRFKREAVTMGRINSPHVAGIHQLEGEGKTPSLVIDFVDGTDLKHVLEQGIPDRKRALKLFEGMVRGVAAIHAAGLVHRDLKPANVMVRNPDHAVIVDFGMVKTIGTPEEQRQRLNVSQGDVELTEAGSLLGTPMYMAPEQAMANEVTPATDVYALGKILFEMLLGERVHNASGIRALLIDIATVDVTQRVAEKLSEAGHSGQLASICLTMLKFEASDRYPDAQFLLAELESFFKVEEQAAVRAEEQRKAEAERFDLELANQKLVIDGQRKRMNLLMVIAGVVGVALMGLSLIFAWGKKQAESARAAAEATAKAEGEAALAAQTAANEAEARAAFERKQREISQSVAQANALIGQGRWQEAGQLLQAAVASDPDHAEARRLLAETLDVLEDPSRRDHYLWLADHSDEEVVRQDYLLRAVMAVDSMPDTSTQGIQRQLEAAQPIIERMSGLHRQSAQIMCDLFAANLRMKSGDTVRGQSDFGTALRRSSDLLTVEHTSWTTAFMAGLYRTLLQDWQGAFQMMDRAAVINPNYHMTLYWRQRIRRNLADQFKPSLRAYGELSAALVDLARLQRMKPSSPVMAVEYADCLLEISFPSIDADANLRQPRIREAIQLLMQAEDSLQEEAFAPLGERVYLQRAKAHALRFKLTNRDGDRRDAERYLEQARRSRTTGEHDRVYQTVLELIRPN